MQDDIRARQSRQTCRRSDVDRAGRREACRKRSDAEPRGDGGRHGRDPAPDESLDPSDFPGVEQARRHEADEFLYGKHYLGIERSDDLVLIQLTVSNTRTVEQKKALFAAIVKKLGDNPGLRPQDVFINLVEVAKENWSFGHGLAQYA
jgi:hypothetical protein